MQYSPHFAPASAMPMQAGSAPDMHLNSRRHLTDHLYLEPDENWKQQTRKEIEPELWPLVEEARARCTHLSPYPPDSVAMKAMTMQYEQTMAYICNVAETTYRERLERERESRKSSPYAYMNEHDLAQYLATPRFAERVSSSATSPDQAQDGIGVSASVNPAHPRLSEDGPSSKSMSGKYDKRALAARFPPRTTCTTDTDSESSIYGPNPTPVSETRTAPEMWREKGSTDSVTWIWSGGTHSAPGGGRRGDTEHQFRHSCRPCPRFVDLLWQKGKGAYRGVDRP